ncbi:hypothetical protein LCGC14_0400540 [marine sediment metagenome]|uniref:Methyltransferase domain-containing protein n=1 Tax=marine sediment metagenome TaxID=412755 RepID=A0A0F9T2M3_9ZZZZ
MFLKKIVALLDKSGSAYWKSIDGLEYTKRNIMSPQELDEFHLKTYGITRTNLNQHFIGDLSRNSLILEIGSNIGNQLLLLQKMGFQHLMGFEINNYAVRCANRKGVQTLQCDILKTSKYDSTFDLVFTSGVLMHINPLKINTALEHIIKRTRKYIWGFEAYAKSYSPFIYRKRTDLLWKAPFVDFYTRLGLKLINEKKLKCKETGNIYSMFLFQKTWSRLNYEHPHYQPKNST